MNDNAQSTVPELSDAELAYMAQAALSWNRGLPVGAINVTAAAGWLTLSGEVLWHCQRQDAAESVRHLPGFAGISNNITVRLSAPASEPRPEAVEGVDEGVAHVIHVGHPLVP